MQQPDLSRLSPFLKNVVLVPSDPSIPLTAEQLSSVFGGEVLPVLREIVRLSLPAAQQTQNITKPAAFYEGALNG